MRKLLLMVALLGALLPMGSLAGSAAGLTLPTDDADDVVWLTNQTLYDGEQSVDLRQFKYESNGTNTTLSISTHNSLYNESAVSRFFVGGLYPTDWEANPERQIVVFFALQQYSEDEFNNMSVVIKMNYTEYLANDGLFSGNLTLLYFNSWEISGNDTIFATISDEDMPDGGVGEMVVSGMGGIGQDGMDETVYGDFMPSLCATLPLLQAIFPDGIPFNFDLLCSPLGDVFVDIRDDDLNRIAVDNVTLSNGTEFTETVPTVAGLYAFHDLYHGTYNLSYFDGGNETVYGEFDHNGSSTYLIISPIPVPDRTSADLYVIFQYTNRTVAVFDNVTVIGNGTQVTLTEPNGQGYYVFEDLPFDDYNVEYNGTTDAQGVTAGGVDHHQTTFVVVSVASTVYLPGEEVLVPGPGVWALLAAVGATTIFVGGFAYWFKHPSAAVRASCGMPGASRIIQLRCQNSPFWEPEPRL